MKRILFVITILFCCTGYSQKKTKEERQAALDAKKAGKTEIKVSLEDMPKGSSGTIEYKNVVTVEGRSANELFELANEWFSHAFNSGERVIDYTSKEAGKVIGKGIIPVDFFYRGAQCISCDITIEVKDGKIRYVINNLVYHQSKSPSFKNFALEKSSWNIENYPKGWGFKTSFYTQVNTKMLALKNNLESFFQANTSDAIEKKKDDW